ncbi:MAG TPA: hypothetical protein PK304_05330 [Mobilitalea sp.]|nr:hypothetical protein [Mobilitalea sp.]
MADTSWNNNPKMKNIDPRKLAVLMELVKEAQGKSIDKLIPLIVNANKKLQAQNLSFTKDESEILIEILTKNMSPKERARFEMLRKLMAGK